MMNERGNEMNPGFQLDVPKLLLSWLRKWWLIVMLLALGAAAAYCYTTEYVTPIYSASVTIYVKNVNDYNSTVDESGSISSGNLNTAERLVATYSSIITSESVLKNVVEQAGINISTSALRSMMTTAQVNETEIFRITISNANPQLAAQIANTVADIAPEEIAEIIQGSSTRIIDYAQVPTAPVSPNVNRNTIIGAAIGAAVALAILTIVFLLDVRIKEEEDLAVICDLPVLGQLPDFSAIRSHHKDYGYDTKKPSRHTGKMTEE